ncbi:amidohydrolase family protein [Antarcticibacterium sp. 1MA-6-2]|uniref:amidohydrolase family protein n=1 Tax=Antarcticibacterium sp. 1MA-6-2 TaxID=2908210 RepID=UPI001F45735B|nr:amidohydrolase family protein [Antarcticibacterium sp. 1MA-6-2]UJH91165.1 amidohydrolase family protein [Antarcticibacterium sp. 1MA-6-2]
MNSLEVRIDSHQHFWKYDPVRYGWIGDNMKSIRRDFLPKDLQPLLNKHNFNGCIAVQADQSEAETEFLLNLAENNSFIKGVVGWIDLSYPDVASRLKKYAQYSLLKGIRHTVYDQNGEYLLDPAFQNGISQLKDFDLTYDILVFDYQLPGAVELVKRFPDQPFVLDHMAKPQISRGITSEWKKNIQNLAALKNVYCKISGMVTETENFSWTAKEFIPFLDVIYESFGEDWLMFGSDWLMSLTAATYSEILSIVQEYFSAYSEEIQSKIFGRNAAEFYNLEI